MASKKKDVAETPLMKQYNEIKVKYPDALLLFRVGDFYETFGEDAVVASKVLGIVLTKRHNGAASETELAGFPHHSLETYLPRLVRAGYRVAVCDQLEDPKLAKKIVKRGVTELVTPGVAFSEQVLEQKRNNFLAAVYITKHQCGVAFVDISTGEFLSGEGSVDYVDKLLQGFQPSEVLYQKNKHHEFAEHFGERFYTYRLDEWVFSEQFGRDILSRHFRTKGLKGFGVEDMPHAIVAAGSILHYLEETQHNRLEHITGLSRIDGDQYVWIDRFTMRNLEILSSANENGVALIDVIDHTHTAMGGRTMRRWLAFPLKDLPRINERHEIVEYLTAQHELRDKLAIAFGEMADLERLASRVAAERCTPREMVFVGKALQLVHEVKALLMEVYDPALKALGERIHSCVEVTDRIASDLNPDAPAQFGKGEVIAAGISDELDELRRLRNHGKDYLKEIQERESAATGITSLKIGYNNVFGYYLEVRNTFKDKVPENWIRKQTLTQAERYITEELKDYESRILGAEEKILSIESALFHELVAFVSAHIKRIQQNAVWIGMLDCLNSFAETAVRSQYVRPLMNDGFVLHIEKGRHPVIEQMLPAGEKYVANDVLLDPDDQQIIMITGPNMSGKSALLRQTALIALLAQAGSFVPAARAEIGLVDKIFTRVGASDNLSAGESTFMVEMNETASILNNLSNRSLVLLDEIGRGTSTYDGISIAWAIAEFIHEQPDHKAKTLFATHYHELNEMANLFPRIRNYNVSVKETGNKILFLRKLEPGGTNHSFGIHVAKMAGMPDGVLRKANEVLRQLEGSHVLEHASDKSGTKWVKPSEQSSSSDVQLSFFQLDDPVLQQIRDQIKGLDIDNLTPVEALMRLHEIKKISGL